MERKKLPIGIDDFRKVIEDGYYYIDKSLFIKELLDSSGETILLPRPRRFGKTLHLSMLRYFFERTEKDTSGLFRDLAIWRQEDAYTGHQGKYPVIFLTFKSVKFDNWHSSFGMIRNLIAEEYERHRRVLQSPLLTEQEKLRFERIVKQEAEDYDYSSSLRELSGYLHKVYGRRVFILIDEYDTPIQEGYASDYYEQVIGFMRPLLGEAFKGNVNLEKGVLTGILQIAKESIFSGLNNLKVCSILDEEFSTHFGLLEPEVETLMREYGIESKMDEVRRWYNGYVFGETLIYNPWSILNYAEKWRSGPQPYWINTASDELLRDLLARSGAQVKIDMEALIGGFPIRKEVDERVVFGQIRRRPDALWSFLLFCGYLRVISRRPRADNPRFYEYELSIPNWEVLSLFEKIVYDWVEETSSLADVSHDDMVRALLDGDLTTFERLFGEVVLATLSYFDIPGKSAVGEAASQLPETNPEAVGGAARKSRDPETVIHVFTLGLLVHLRSRYEVRSNRESGYGRYDVMLIPLDPTRKGVVIEFKAADKADARNLEAAADAALGQIEAMRYEVELKERGIRDIVKIGIAIAGKSIRVKGGRPE